MTTTNKPTVLFITAGLGGPLFEQAADRLVNQAGKFDMFSRLHAVKESEVLEMCPRLLEWFTLIELRDTKGFGWYTWKANLAYQAIVQKRWGEFDLVMYLDAGCEMFSSSFSHRKLVNFLDHAEHQGNTLFSIPTPELEYTKRDLFNYFPGINPSDSSNQFQSGSWIFKTSESVDFVSQWEALSSLGIHMTDESPSKVPENAKFVVHRYDQSIFSLIAKSTGCSAVREVPPGNANSIRAKVRGFFFPFWWARNRTGLSMIPLLMRVLGILTIKLKI